MAVETWWGSEFPVNSTTAGVQKTVADHAVATLASGRFIVAYESDEAGAANVRGRMFEADGTPVGPDFVLASTTDGLQFQARIAALPDGRFVATWYSTDNGDGSQTCIRARFFSGDGAPLGDDFVVNVTGNLHQSTPDVIGLSDGRALFTWTSFDTGDGSNKCVRTRAFEADGTPFEGQDRIVNTTTPSDQTSPHAVALQGGAFAIFWTDWDAGGDGASSCIRGRIYGQPDDPLDFDFVVNSTPTGSQSAVAAAALTDGRMIVAWASQDPGDGQGYCLRARIVNANGTFGGADFTVNTTAMGDQQAPAIVALADGRFIIFFESADTGDGGTGQCVRGRLYNADGTADGADFFVNTTSAQNQFAVSASALADGRVVVTWTDNSGDGSAARVVAQIIDPRGATITGDAGNNTIYANTGEETVHGLGGDDTIFGMDGGDVLNGGDGNDTLKGGAGADVLNGGAGEDTADYGDKKAAVVVTLAGASGAGVTVGGMAEDTISNIENVTGGSGDDVLTGDALTNRLDGGAGSDQLYGMDGADRLIGGAGADVLNGGAGEDTADYSDKTAAVVVTLAGASAAGVTVGGMAEDTISNIENVTGGSGNDVLMGDPSTNRLDGGAGGDQLYGVEGTDHLIGGAGADVLDGGEGIDFANYSTAATAVIARLVAPGINEGDAAGDSYISIEGVIGSLFDDTLAIGDGGGSIWANAGNDHVFGGAGGDDLHGMDGIDHLHGGAAADILDGGNGVDFANYSTAAGPVLANLLDPGGNVGEAAGDTYISVEGLIGSAFDDALRIGNSGGSIWALRGNDHLFGGAGNDDLHGMEHNDHLHGGAGADVLDGGIGVDFANYSTAAGPVLANLVNPGGNVGEAAGDTYVSIEGIIGSGFDDTLRIGDSGGSIWALGGGDHLFGGAGNDDLHGMDGNDHLHGGAGADMLDGGNGYDFANYSTAAGPVLANLLDPGGNVGEAAGDTYASIEGIIGSNFDDTLRIGDGGGSIWALGGSDHLFGGSGNDDLHGMDGNDHLHGGAGADILDGGNSVDFANYSTAAGAVLANLLDPGGNTGDAAGDTYASIEGLIGSAFGDTLHAANGGGSIWANAGNDTLFGGAGNDDLHGGAGNDVLYGSGGADLLDGGTGDDTFVFGRGSAHGDILADFEGNGAAPGDSLVFSGYGTAGQGASFTQVDATHWSINSADGVAHDVLTFANGASIHAGDWLFV